MDQAPRRKLAGFVLLELAFGIVVLMTALSIGMMALNQATLGRHLRERRDAAREAVALSLERLRAFRPSALPKVGEKIELGVPPHLKTMLPGGRCTLTISSIDTAGLVRAHVEVQCNGLKQSESGEAVLSSADAATSASTGAKP